MNKLFAQILGVDLVDTKRENWKRSCKTNGTLEGQYLLVASQMVDDKSDEYEYRGETEKEYLPKLYKYFGIPTRDDVKDTFARNVIIGRQDKQRLKELIVRRQMSSLGYASVMFEGESAWQKDERRLSNYEDTKSKWPWLYGGRH